MRQKCSAQKYMFKQSLKVLERKWHSTQGFSILFQADSRPLWPYSSNKTEAFTLFTVPHCHHAN